MIGISQRLQHKYKYTSTRHSNTNNAWLVHASNSVNVDATMNAT